MITPEEWDTIKQLIDRLPGSPKMVALRCGRSLTTVNEIRTGKLQRPTRTPERANGPKTKMRKVGAYRCDGCRNLVTLRPCNICLSRNGNGN